MNRDRPVRAYSLMAAVVIVLAVMYSHTSAQTVSNDQLIVPGKRVGTVNLGMDIGALYRVMGEPKNSVTANNGTWAYYQWNGLMVFTNLPNGKVTAIVASAPYTMKNGIGVGSSELALRANMSAPVWTKAVAPGVKEYCFGEGLDVSTQAGKVSSIKVWSPGCGSMSGNYVCFEFENGMNRMLRECKHED